MSISSMEKTSMHTSHVEKGLGDPEQDERIKAFPPEEQRRIIRRIDKRLVLTCGGLYCISLLDRTNLGAASVAGMQVSLGMNASNNAYTIVSLIFFITYAICQAPSTVLIRKVGPRVFLTFIVVAWGAVELSFGFTPNWQVMGVLRVILGALEAGFYPGCVYLLGSWYMRYEVQKRYALFYLIGSMASGWGGILAYGLMQMDGVAGLEGWRWIFIIEGLLTCLLGIAAYVLLVDFPEKSPNSWKFLNEAEAAFVVARIDHDRADVIPETFSLKSYLGHAADTKVWAFAALYMLTTTGSYSIAYFLPIILKGSLGFSEAEAQCLTAPPYVFAAIFMFIQSYFADKWRLRGPIIAGNALLGIIGLALLGYVTTPAVRYFGVFLATTSCNANCPALLSYQSNNIRGQWKRALTSATLVGAGAIGGIIGTTVFRAKDAPDYRPGILATLLANVLIILIVLALSWKFRRANRRAEQGGKPIEGLVGFRYTL